MSKTDKIKRYVQTADQIRDLGMKYSNVKKPARIDKYGLGFNKDTRFSSLTFTLSLDNWKGEYGDSSCGRWLRITDTDIVKKHLLEYLNTNLTKIMNAVSDSIMVEAKTMKDDAISELESELEKIKNIE